MDAAPPQVQRGDVVLADGFLPPRFGRDGFDGDIVSDQATIVGWHLVVQFLLYVMHAQYSANSRISQKPHASLADLCRRTQLGRQADVVYNLARQTCVKREA